MDINLRKDNEETKVIFKNIYLYYGFNKYDNSNFTYFNISEVQTNLQTNFDGFVPESLVNKISKIDGIKNYDGVIQGAGLDFKKITNIEPVKNVIQYSDDNKYKNLFDVEVHTSTEFDNKFVSKSFKLIEGRHIVATDKNKVLIHYTNAIFNTSDNVENVLSKVNIS